MNDTILKKIDKLKNFCDLPPSATWINYTLLNTALQCEQKDVALFLLNEGCNVNSTSEIIGNTPLHYAVRLEDIELVQILLSKGASIMYQNHKGDTPLHTAFMNTRNNELVDILLSHIESTGYINLANNIGLTHMHIACIRNKLDIVDSFLKNDIKNYTSINSDSSLWPSYTPLHFSIEFECMEVMKLLKMYINDYEEYYGDKTISPVNLSKLRYQNASMIHYILCMRVLKHINKDNNEVEVETNQFNFHLACLEGDKEIVEKYLSHGAKVNRSLHSFKIYEYDTPLHCAARSESTDTVKLLLNHNAKLNKTNEYKMTPLHTAFYSELYTEDTDVVDLLISAYNLKKCEDVIDSHGLSYFHIACSRGNEEIIEEFLKKGVDVNSHFYTVCFTDNTALYLSVKYNLPKTTRLLLKYGADISIHYRYTGTTVLHFAIEKCYMEILEIFLDNIFDINTIKDDNEGNAWHALAVVDNYLWQTIDRIKFAKKLHSIGCNINHQNVNGDTPLHIATRMVDIEFICTLLDYGADINLENETGETPFMARGKNELYRTINARLMILNPKIYVIYFCHIEKLKTIGYHVSEDNKLFCTKLLNEQEKIDPNNRYFTPDYISSIKQQYIDELQKMKHIKVANCISLYNILFADANKMASFCKNQKLIDILNLDDFDKQFPSYGYLLRLQYIKGQARKVLLKPAKDSFPFIIKRQFPDCCSEKVFSYLSDDDLRSLKKIKCSKD